MSSTTYVEGEITFDPPLTFAVLRDPGPVLAPYLADARTYQGRHDRDVAVLIEEAEPVDTPDGVLIKKHARRIVCAWPEGRNYHVGEQLAEIVDALARIDRTYTGEFTLLYQASSIADFQAWRLRVERRGSRVFVRRIDARLDWVEDPNPVTVSRPSNGYTRAKARR